MEDDPIVAEVRKIRHEIEAECNNDMHSLFLRAIEVERKFSPHVTQENIFVFIEKDVPESKPSL